MELVQLSASDFEEALDFLDLVFSTAYAPTHFGNMLPILYQPTDEDMQHNFAIREHGRIRAIVGMFPSQIQAGSKILHLEGIGGVSSHPNDRGKGWMKQLMQHCIAQMQASNTDLSFLTGLRQRYQYFGYEKAGIQLHYQLHRTNLRHTEKRQPALPSLHFTPLKDSDVDYIEACKRLHDLQPFYCVRPLEKFYLFLVSLHAKPWVALNSDGKVVGYLVTTSNQDRITEIFADDQATFTAMIYRWFAEREIAKTVIQLAPWQERYARVLSDIAEEFHLSDNGNWRIFNWENVLGALLPLKNSHYLLADGTVRIGISGYGTVSVCVSGGTVTCHKTDLQPDVTWDSLTATRILLGHFPANYHTEIPAALRTQVQSWFPLPLSWLEQNYV